MPESGIEKMEERAEAARSRWRVVAFVAMALLVAKSLVGKAMELIWRRRPNANSHYHVASRRLDLQPTPWLD